MSCHAILAAYNAIYISFQSIHKTTHAQVFKNNTNNNNMKIEIALLLNERVYFRTHLLLNRRLVKPENFLDNCKDTCLVPESMNENNPRRKTRFRNQAAKIERENIIPKKEKIITDIA